MNRPCFFEVPPDILLELSNAVAVSLGYQFVQNVDSRSVSSESVSGATYRKCKPFYRMKRRDISGNIFLISFSASGNSVKTSSDAPGDRESGSK